MQYAVLTEAGRSILIKADVSRERIEAIYASRNQQIKSIRRVVQPSLKALERMVFEGIATCPDGCRTELDGQCVHGWASWLEII